MKENNIYQALSKAQGMIGSVTKNAVNPFFKSNYADLNQILEEIRGYTIDHPEFIEYLYS